MTQCQMAVTKLFSFVKSKISTRLVVLMPLVLLLGLTVNVHGAGKSTQYALPEPVGRVVIEITGNIQNTNGKNSARFDYAMLEKVGLIDFLLDTPWTETGTRFEGVLTRRLLETVGAEGTEILAEAADGYSVTLPMSDLTEFDTMLALSMNGKKMRLRNKGPAWILYDADDRPDIVDAVLNSRMVWQLRRLDVR